MAGPYRPFTPDQSVPTDEERQAAFGLIRRESTVAWVPIGLCFADRYQRPLNETRLLDYQRRGFTPDALGIVVLSRRAPGCPNEGRFAIVDGRHRIALAQRSGWPEIQANVLRNKTYEEEAHLFWLLNYRLPVTALGKFNARLERREADALKIREILAWFELRVGKSINNSVGVVNAVDALDRLYAETGPYGFYQVMAILNSAWSRERNAYKGAVVDGVKQFWMRYHRVADPFRLVERLAITTPDALTRASANNSGGSGTRIGKQMVSLYNTRLSRARLPDWVDHPGRTLTVNQEYGAQPLAVGIFAPPLGLLPPPGQPSRASDAP